MISGSPGACPSANPEHCATGFPNPGPAEEYRAFHPKQLSVAYGASNTAMTGAGQNMVVLQHGGTVDPDDINAYTDSLGSPRVNLHQVTLDGAASGRIESFEATLDVETVAAFAPELDRLTLISGPQGTLGEFAVYGIHTYSSAFDVRKTGGVLASVTSLSFGQCEAVMGDQRVCRFHSSTTSCRQQRRRGSPT